MIRQLLSASLLLATLGTPSLAEDLSYYLPTLDYDPAIPTPSSFLGWETGDRHITHHELVAYMQRLAEVSPRVTIAEYARTHGRRALLMLTITSPSNHGRIEQIRQQHRQLSDPDSSSEVATDELPAVINMGYSVHGDEPSAGNAAPLVAYYLAAGRGEEMERLLSNVVVLMDPCLNPDGFNRFANWANAYRGKSVNADPAHAEHNQPWPGGRVNYYWFDLNRDWLPAQHPESQGRLQQFHAWKPDVVLDFHEMGTNSTYFFQPGIPERANPLIPEGNILLTNRFAKYHAAALDRIGSLYFTEEVFDDFYPGKGSSYPDLHGGVGILFEQASSRGHLQESHNGDLSFPFTIRNQVTTSLSSLAATADLRVDLLDHRRTFHTDALTESRNQPVRAWVFQARGDTARLAEFAALLRRHDIECGWANEDVSLEGARIPSGSLVVPAHQPEYRFLRALFEQRTTFRENIFYDVSTWTLPLAFNLQQSMVTVDLPADGLSDDPQLANDFAPSDEDYAWIVDWRSSLAPATLAELLQRDVRVRVATREFSTDSEGATDHHLGSLVVPLGIQTEEARTHAAAILTRSSSQGVRVTSAATGLTAEGIDLGSGSLRPIERPRILMVVDGGVSRYSAGAAWHHLDARLGLSVTLVPQSRLQRVDLSRYNTILLPSGRYETVSHAFVDSLKEWVSAGGTVIATGRAIEWVAAEKLTSIDFRTDATNDPEPPQEHSHAHYSEARRDQALQLISGAIFETRVDLTHPITYGLTDDRLPLFRNNRVIMSATDNRYSNPVLCSASPLMSGYCSEENVDLIAGSASVVVRGRNNGRFILIAEDPVFRAFWHGSSRLLENAIFYGSVIREP